MVSVLQDWVMELPLREQGTLLTGVRGCDTAPKDPSRLNAPERRLAAFLRYCFMTPADPREVDYEPGCFFQSMPPSGFRQSSIGHYPLHWVSHIMHGFEIVAYRHPDPKIKAQAMDIYRELVHGLHLNVETFEQMVTRLSEDRVETGTVVS
jgi:hypothetical protein